MLGMKWIAWVLLALAAVAAGGQTVPTAYAPPQTLLAGFEYANMQAGFPNGSNTRLSGVGVFLNFNFNRAVGVEAHYRQLNFGGWQGQRQQDYLIGPRYTFLNRGKWRPYASFLVGEAHIQYPFQLGAGDQLALAPGGGVDYRFGARWTARAAYEFQILPNSPNFANVTHYGMKPNGFQFGLAYRIR
jgi:hypothetical protein